LCDVEKLWWGFADGGECVAEHGIAEGAGGADDFGSGAGEFAGADVADALAFFFAEEGESSAGSAAEAAFVGAGGFDEGASLGDYGARLFVDVLVAAEVAGVVVDDAVAGLERETVAVAGHELGVVFDLG